MDFYQSKHLSVFYFNIWIWTKNFIPPWIKIKEKQTNQERETEYQRYYCEPAGMFRWQWQNTARSLGFLPTKKVYYAYLLVAYSWVETKAVYTVSLQVHKQLQFISTVWVAQITQSWSYVFENQMYIKIKEVP